MDNNFILQVSGHVAIDKAAEVLGAQIRHVPIDLKSGIIGYIDLHL